VARRGLFEEAHGGTLFLDEAGSMGLAAQGKLLRVLEDRKVRRVGENRTIDVDVRILAATNVDLEDAVASGAFRADLYFRLAVLTLQVPALGTAHDIELRRALPGQPGRSRQPIRLRRRRLLRRSVPGNIRELRNAIEQALVFSNGPVLEAGDFPALRVALGAPPGLKTAVAPGEKTLPITRERILEAIERAGGNRVEAAKLLSVSRSTFYRLLTQFGLDAAPESA
jgi:DNA-binding NtrC family response regulator